MLYSDITSLALNQTYSDSTQVTAAQLLTYANISYHAIENIITESVADDYFYDYFKADTVANQSEYTLPISSATAKGYKKIISVEIKRATTDSYYALTESSKNTSYGVGLTELGTDLPKSQAIFDIKDSSIFVYPTPLNSVTD